jgi:hypothetical protein
MVIELEDEKMIKEFIETYNNKQFNELEIFRCLMRGI